MIPLSESEKSDVGYLSLPDTHSTTQPELESRFYFRICTKETKEENRKVLQVHKKLRDEAEHYLEPEAKHLIGIAYFRQGNFGKFSENFEAFFFKNLEKKLENFGRILKIIYQYL